MGKILLILGAFVLVSGAAVQPAAAQDSTTAAQQEAQQEAGAGESRMADRSVSGLPVPRFVSLASDKVFVRTGPALRYPIKWVYEKGHLPVEVIQEFDTWRRIRDIDGDDGWIHQSLLSGSRSVVVRGERPLSLYRESSDQSRIMALLEPGVIAAVSSCEGAWCRVAAQGLRGHAQRKFLWGIYDQEDFD